MKIFLRLFFVLFLFCTVGCLEIGEIIKLNNDGSVDYTMRISIPEMPEKGGKKSKADQKEMEDDIQEFFSVTMGKGLNFVDKSDQELFGIKVFTLKLKAEKLTDLNQFYKKLAEKGSAKEKGEKDKKGKEAFDQLYSKALFKVKKNKKGTLTITRSFTPPKIKEKKIKDKDKEKMGKEFEQLFMNMLRFRFEIIVPTQVVETNGTQWIPGDLR
ncbi:MAG: hypothetical protein R3257_02980, partial [bacterium]|nr:hypothetical protein [bacterium]